MNVLTYGAGVDSTAMLHLAIDGEIPKPDVVVFADTQAEATSTHATLLRSEKACEEAGIPWRRVTAGNLMDWRANGSLHTPLHFVHDERTARGKVKIGDDGMLRRTCTSRFKIEPVRYFTRDLGATRHAPANMLLGITLDEAAVRMGDSEVKYIRHQYPLVDLQMTGASCEAYLAEKSIEAEKSACVMCPLSNAARMNKADVDDRDMAVAYDRDVREAIPDHPPLFVDRDTMAPLPIEAPEEPYTLFSACPGNWC